MKDKWKLYVAIGLKGDGPPAMDYYEAKWEIKHWFVDEETEWCVQMGHDNDNSNGIVGFLMRWDNRGNALLIIILGKMAFVRKTI